MKIIIINLEQANQYGAIGSHTRGIINGFSQIGNYNIHSITNENIDSLNKNVFQHIITAKSRSKILYRLMLLPKLREKIHSLINRRQDYIIIYSRFHFWFSPFIAFSINRIKKNSPDVSVKLITEYNDVVTEQIRYLIKKNQYSFIGKLLRGPLYQSLIHMIEKYSFSKSDLIVTVTDKLKEYVENVSNTPGIRIENATARENIDLTWNYLKTQKLRIELGLENDDELLYLSHVGTLTAWDGLNHLLEAIACSKHSNFLRLVILGEGVEKEPLIELAEKLNLKKQIIFLNKMPHAKALNYVKIADLVPLLKHNFSYGLSPIKYYEALGMGKFILATNIAHINKCAKKGHGIVVDTPISIKDLSEKINLVYFQRNEIRNKTKTIVEHAFKFETWDSRCQEIHRQVITKNTT